MSSPRELRALIVAQDSLARAGLAALVAGLPGCVVARQTSGEDDLPHELDIYHPDVVIWDLGFAPTLGLERLADLQGLDTPVIVLLPSEDYANSAWDSGTSGVRYPIRVESYGLLLRGGGDIISYHRESKGKIRD